MHVDNAKTEVALKNLIEMCDIEFILGLCCILPLFEIIHMLFKIAQGKDLSVCYFVNIVKLVQDELYKPYCDPYAKFEDLTFNDFNFIEFFTS